MSLAATNRRGAALNWRLAVKGIHSGSRLSESFSCRKAFSSGMFMAGLLGCGTATEVAQPGQALDLWVHYSARPLPAASMIAWIGGFPYPVALSSNTQDPTGHSWIRPGLCSLRQEIPNGSQLHPGRNRVSRSGARVRPYPPPRRCVTQSPRTSPARQGRLRALAENPVRKGLDCRRMAGGVRRHRLVPDPALHFRGGVRERRCAAPHAFWFVYGRPGDHRLWQRMAKEALSAAHSFQRGLVVPGLFRTWIGFRPGFAQDPRRAPGRSLYRQRPEDVEYPRPVGGHVLLPGAHLQRRQETGGHFLPADRHALARRDRTSDHDARRRARGERALVREREGAGAEPGGRRGARLDLRQVPVVARAHRHRRSGALEA